MRRTSSWAEVEEVFSCPSIHFPYIIGWMDNMDEAE